MPSLITPRIGSWIALPAMVLRITPLRRMTFYFPELTTAEVAMLPPDLLQELRKPGLIMIVLNAITIIMGINRSRVLVLLHGIRRYFGP
ncbi:MAG: hypothetical protein EBT92_02245 [Planctomycetes bacterium]|nr:hypothetical protein [Planctomycetota bacterium]